MQNLRCFYETVSRLCKHTRYINWQLQIKCKHSDNSNMHKFYKSKTIQQDHLSPQVSSIKYNVLTRGVTGEEMKLDPWLESTLVVGWICWSEYLAFSSTICLFKLRIKIPCRKMNICVFFSVRSQFISDKNRISLHVNHQY